MLDRRKAIACLVAGAVLLAGCSRQRRLVVGSKNSTEQVILGEIVAQHIEHKLRTTVQRRLNLGSTLLAHEALLSGQIDVYPEYSGAALTVILKLPPLPDPSMAFERVRREYENLRLVWMPPLGFSNGFAMTIRGPEARANHFETLSDAMHYAPKWDLGAGPEFMERPDGYPALMKTYNLPQRSAAKTMDPSLLYPALERKQVDMIAGNATDGLLSALDVTQLHDGRGAFLPYQASLVAREDVLSEYPGLRDALDDLSGRIAGAAMQKLNYEVDGRRQPVAVVAKSFLRQAGLE